MPLISFYKPWKHHRTWASGGKKDTAGMESVIIKFFSYYVITIKEYNNQCYFHAGTAVDSTKLLSSVSVVKFQE